MFIIQNSSKIFPYLQILSFLKNSLWNLKFSYICMNEEKWKKSKKMKFYSYIQGIPAFRDFTIHNPCYSVILFQAPILWITRHFMILKKKIQKQKFRIFFCEKISDFNFLLHLEVPTFHFSCNYWIQFLSNKNKKERIYYLLVWFLANYGQFQRLKFHEN